MAISIDYGTNVISVPQADLTFISGTLYELDTDQFRLDLMGIQDSEEGIVFPTTHKHNTEVLIAGDTYARQLIIQSPYTVKFEDGQYAVKLVGSNNNIFDEGVIVRNQVSIIPTNSAGLISGATITTQVKEMHQFRGLDADNPLTITDAAQTVDGKTVNVTDDGTTTTVDRV